MSTTPNNQTPKVTRPVLRYYGGKWRVAPWVLDHFAPHEVYVELFCGAASVLMRKPRSYSEVINDVSADVANLFFVLQDRGQRELLAEALWLTPFSRDEWERAYLEDDNPDRVERARRLCVRSFLGYNSSSSTRHKQTAFRTRLSEGRHSPAMNWARYPDSLTAVTERLRGVIVENRAALEVLRVYDSPRTLVYADPPYPKKSRANKHKIYAHEMMDEAAHVALAESLHAAESMVVLSSYPNELYDRELYADWRREETAARADSGGLAEEQRVEVLYLNPAASAALEAARAHAADIAHPLLAGARPDTPATSTTVGLISV